MFIFFNKNFGYSSKYVVNYGLQRISRDSSRGGILIPQALTLTAWESISDDQLNLSAVVPAVQAIVDRLPAFTEELAVVPDSTDSNYANIVESNNSRIVGYVRTNAVVGIGAGIISQDIVDTICDPLKYTGKIAPTSATRFTELLSIWGQNWAVFDRAFLKAVSIRVQQRIDLRDRYAGLGLTSDEAASIEKDVRKVAFVKSQFSKQTSKRSYLEETTAKQKQSDIVSFKNNISKASVLAKIVDATINQIPARAVFAQQFAFNLNPKDSERATALQNAVRDYKVAQIAAYRADRNGYKFSDHFTDG